jgi:hypothetical protein
MFASFIVAHVYLTTTGPEPLGAIRAMITGWDEVEVDAEVAEAAGDGGHGTPAAGEPQPAHSTGD